MSSETQVNIPYIPQKWIYLIFFIAGLIMGHILK